MEEHEQQELIDDIVQLEQTLFKTTNSYRLIEQQCAKRCLNPDEQQQLKKDVHYVFTHLIRILHNACTDLTEKDILFCCLKIFGLDNRMIGHCM